MSEPKLRRGDPHPTDPNKVFYQRVAAATDGKRWVTRERWEEINAKNREYENSRKEESSAYGKSYYQANAEKVKARSAEWYANNKGKAAATAKMYRARDPERVKERKREHYHRTKEHIKARQQGYYEANRQPYLDRARAHKQIPETKKRRNAREQERKLTEPLYGLKCGVRSRISTEVRKRGFAKNSKSAKVLGCDWPTYKAHLEGLFKGGMSWENRAEWHIDHITPLASATTEEGLQALLHYKNTQPLWKEENLRKAARMPD